jgi:beta-glucosidase
VKARVAAGLLLALLSAACTTDGARTPPIETTPPNAEPSPTTAGSASVTAESAATIRDDPAAGPFRDPDVPIEERIDDLLPRMTLDEKIGQMTLVAEPYVSPSLVADYHIGAVLSGGGGAPEPNTTEAWIEMTSALQDGALSTRLGIPMMYGSDAVHGHGNLWGAVIFPHNVGLGAARSADLVERIARATAVEMAATGVLWNYAPVLAVPRDIRWGRSYEGFGEDPDLVGALGAAYVRGLQGADLSAPHTVLATPKHFVGDGATQWGTSTTETYWIDQGDVTIDEAQLRAIHVAPYADAIDAGALSVMASYSSFQGTKLHASRELLTDLLKGELGFEGFVVSDWAAIDQIDPDDYAASVVSAINAGVDMNMVPGAFVEFIDILRDAVEAGEVPLDRIDDAVRRILRAKFALGLFEEPYPDPVLAAEIGSDAHRALAAEAVERSLVLLTHREGTLPVSGSTLFVAGEPADDVGWQSGGWTIEWQGAVGPITPGTTILDGIIDSAGPMTRVVYDPLGRFADDGDPERADTGIVVIGERPYAEGMGDDSRLAVGARQLAVVEAVRSNVDTLIVIVVSGRPVILGEITRTADAVVAAWLPGSEGAAVAAPLFGAVPFTGTLPYSWPRHAEQLPFDFGSGPLEACDAPLFTYGHGLTTEDSFMPPELDCEDPA